MVFCNDHSDIVKPPFLIRIMLSSLSKKYYAMTIINTKLTPPSGGSRIIARSELVEKLREYANGLLTLISAPSGYGKTSAVCQWTCKPESVRPGYR